MKAIRYDRFGPPHEVASCAEVPDPWPPAADEVVIEVEACPINPVDLLTVEGRYAVRPVLPATPGSEGVGRIQAVGDGVRGLAPGDRVLHLGRDNWVQRIKTKATQAIKTPAGADPRQLAMAKINPATALLMLRNYRVLAPGDWVIQDAANSGVGTCLIRLAQAAGLRNVNVVRREGLAERLTALGADVVLVDGPDLAERVRDATGGAAIRLAVDAVAGDICIRLADCLADDGVVVNYGLLSGKPCQITAHQTVFRGITLTGFWLARYLGSAPAAEIRALYDEILPKVADGTLAVPVEASYGLDEIGAALAHAARGGRGGKVLLLPNGPIA